MNPLRRAAGLFQINIAIFLPASLLSLSLFANALHSYGQQQNTEEPTAQSSTQPEVEEDPTKPVFFSVRNEYRDLRSGAWANTVIFRVDKLSFRNLSNKGGARGVIFRFDLPLNTVHTGAVTKAGLGDLYSQLLYIPRVRKRFAFAIGSGIVIPTATHDLLGRGKLSLAPTAVPVWYFAKRKRIALIRFQNYFSIAGKKSRPDVNYFLADPTVIHPLNRQWWIGANTELRWDWKTGRGSGITGIQIGRMVKRKYGFWAKPEIPWGSGRTGGFNIKFTVFRVR